MDKDQAGDEQQQLPVVVLTFANPHAEGVKQLRKLAQEKRRLEAALKKAVRAKHCELEIQTNVTLKEIVDVFRDCRDRVVILHYAGHARGGELLMESLEGEARAVDAGRLAEFLGRQRSLELVFLNGCSTQDQVRGFLDAGVSAVIATRQDVRDGAATEFAARFYQHLASGAPIGTAFNRAEAELKLFHTGDPRRAYRRDPRRGGGAVADGWPWYRKFGPGAEERVAGWSLAEAAGDPLFSIPQPVTEGPPPVVPFKHLDPFTHRDAEIFFGRGREIRDLYLAVSSPDTPIVLLFGASGVGKSSLLAAGLVPRLENPAAPHGVSYQRRDDRSLLATLAAALETGTGGDGIAAAWRRREAGEDRPLVVILDQVEGAYTHPLAGRTPEDEVGELVDALLPLFAVPRDWPRGKLVLGFRKEWWAEIHGPLVDRDLAHGRVPIQRLKRAGIVEAIEGPTRSKRLRSAYKLKVESELARIIADDLREDPDTAVAPYLQIVLKEMWDKAQKKDPAAPRFTVKDYQGSRRQGKLLDGFVGDKLEGLEKELPVPTESGLTLDLLNFHTTPQGTAATWSQAEVKRRYGGERWPEVEKLLRECKDRHLLADAAREGEDPGSRLAHDTLAPLVRQRFASSDRPGQRARRILKLRTPDWKRGEGSTLDAADLAIVERGAAGMRRWCPDEEELVEASRRAKRERERAERQRERARRDLERARRDLERAKRKRRRLAAAAAVLILLAASVAAWKWRDAVRRAREAKALDRVAIANYLLTEDPTSAGLLLLEVPRPEEIPRVPEALYEVLDAPLTWIVFEGHSRAVADVSFSPDSTRIVTASADKTARVWDRETGEELRCFEHEAAVTAASFSPDGQRVVTASRDGTVRVWDVERVEVTRTLPLGAAERVGADEPGGAILDASFSPDGGRIVAAYRNRSARVWNVASGDVITLFREHQGPVNAASFSPDGQWVVTASDDQTARVWSAGTGKLITTFCRHVNSVNDASFSPDGRWVITASDDATALVWKVEPPLRRTASRCETDDNLVAGASHEEGVKAASFSPDGKSIVTASDDGFASLKNLENEEEALLIGHERGVRAVSFSPDGLWIATASGDRTVRLWQAVHGTEIATFTGYDAVLCPDGQRIVTTSTDTKTRLCEVDSGDITTLVWKAENADVGASDDGSEVSEIKPAACSPDGQRIATAYDDNAVRVWMPESREVISLEGHTGTIRDVSFSPDGERLVTASDDGTARVWPLRQSIRYEGPMPRIVVESLSRDGTATVTRAEELRFRTLKSDRSIPLVHLVDSEKVTAEGEEPPEVMEASFSADGSRILTWALDGAARVWDARSGGPPVVLKHDGWILTAASFSPDGTRVVTASHVQSDGVEGKVRGRAQVWNVVSGEKLVTLEGHEGTVSGASFHPIDSRRVVTASKDRTARIWDAASGGELKRLRGHRAPLWGASYSSDGLRVVTASEDKTARIWDARSGDELARLDEGHTKMVRSAVFSSDGERILTVSQDKTARVWLVPAEIASGKYPRYLQSRIRARTRRCLSPDFRQQWLAEEPGEARQEYAICGDCAKDFVADLKNRQLHVAWKAYQDCLERRRHD